MRAFQALTDSFDEMSGGGFIAHDKCPPPRGGVDAEQARSDLHQLRVGMVVASHPYRSYQVRCPVATLSKAAGKSGKARVPVSDDIVPF